MELKDFAIKALQKSLSYEEIVYLIDRLSDMTNFNNDNNAFYAYFIITTLQKDYNEIPLVKLSLQAIESTIVLSMLEQKTSSLHNIKPEKKIEVKDIPEGEPEENLEKYFLEKFDKGFPRAENPGLVYPEPGATSNVIVPRALGPDGKTYNLNFLIDSEGKVLRHVDPPQPVRDAEDYEEIYASLVGTMLEYQNGVKNDE